MGIMLENKLQFNEDPKGYTKDGKNYIACRIDPLMNFNLEHHGIHDFIFKPTIIMLNKEQITECLKHGTVWRFLDGTIVEQVSLYNVDRLLDYANYEPPVEQPEKPIYLTTIGSVHLDLTTKPAPAPTPAPEPAPQPEPSPEPAPQPEPQPEPAPEPQPEPDPTDETPKDEPKDDTTPEEQPKDETPKDEPVDDTTTPEEQPKDDAPADTTPEEQPKDEPADDTTPKDEPIAKNGNPYYGKKRKR